MQAVTSSTAAAQLNVQQTANIHSFFHVHFPAGVQQSRCPSSKLRPVHTQARGLPPACRLKLHRLTLDLHASRVIGDGESLALVMRSGVHAMWNTSTILCCLQVPARLTCAGSISPCVAHTKAPVPRAAAHAGPEQQAPPASPPCIPCPADPRVSCAACDCIGSMCHALLSKTSQARAAATASQASLSNILPSCAGPWHHAVLPCTRH